MKQFAESLADALQTRRHRSTAQILDSSPGLRWRSVIQPALLPTSDKWDTVILRDRPGSRAATGKPPRPAKPGPRSIHRCRCRPRNRIEGKITAPGKTGQIHPGSAFAPPAVSVHPSYHCLRSRQTYDLSQCRRLRERERHCRDPLFQGGRAGALGKGQGRDGV